MMSPQFYIATVYMLLLATSASAKMATRSSPASSLLFETPSSFDDSTFSAGSFSSSKFGESIFDSSLSFPPASSSSGYAVTALSVGAALVGPLLKRVVLDIVVTEGMGYARDYFYGNNDQLSQKVQFLKQELEQAKMLESNLVMHRTQAEQKEMMVSNKTHAEKYAKDALELKEREQEAKKRVQELEQHLAEATGELLSLDADE